MIRREDFVRPPCTCAECRQAGVDTQEQVRDPDSGKWLHGYALKRYYDAADRCLAGFQQLVKSKGMMS
jgi:hypothetical protein